MLIKLELNHRGINKLLTDEVAGDIERRGRNVQKAASKDMTEPDGMMLVDAADAKRARAVVVTTSVEAMRREANEHALTRAIEAGAR